MPTTPALWVLVDYTDPEILYAPVEDWTVDTNIADAFAQTAIFTSAPEASFSYRFNGSRVALLSPFSTLNISHQTTHPSWECFVDNKSVSTNNSFSNFPLQSLCEVDNLDAKGHVIALQVGASTGLQEDVPLYFDYIKYLPFDSASIASNSTTSLSFTDPQAQLGSEWSSLGTTNAAFTIGSSGEGPLIFSLIFTGTSLQWYGLSTNAISEALSKTSFSLNLARSSLNYTVDSGSDNPIEAVVEFGDPSAASAYDVMLFRTPQLAPGTHNFTIFFGGDSNFTPLTLDFLAFSNTSFSSIDDTPSSSGATSSLSVSLPTTTSPTPTSPTPTLPQTHRSNSFHPVALAGALAGLAAAICVILAGVHVLRRRTNTRHTPTTQIYATLSRPFLNTANMSSRPREKDIPAESSTSHASISRSDLPRVEHTITDRNRRRGFGKLQRRVTGPNPSVPQGTSPYAIENVPTDAPASSHPIGRIHYSSSGRSVDLSGISPTGELNNSSAIQEIERGTHLLPVTIGISRDLGDDVAERIVRHQDSGVRLYQSVDSMPVLELPPNYTVY